MCNLLNNLKKHWWGVGAILLFFVALLMVGLYFSEPLFPPAFPVEGNVKMASHENSIFKKASPEIPTL